MRVGEGILNAIIVCIVVAAAHWWIRKANEVAPRGPKTTEGFFPRKQHSAVTEAYVNAWPPTPPPAPAEWVSPQHVSSEEEERAALYRLVFAGSRERETHSPKLMPDYSGLHMAAEQSTQLPMFDIGTSNKQTSDTISGIESWGAGYAPL